MDINILSLKEYAKDLKVLYVEDDEPIKEQIKIFLSKFFPVIDTAKDGQEGLELFGRDRYDIVITDIVMPHMDGIEFARRIKELNEEQIIVVTSAYNEVDNLMDLINIGIDKFVMKPINNKQFLIMLYNISRHLYIAASNKRLESELVSKAKEIEAILNFVDNQIAVIENKKIVMMNSAFAALFGFNDVDGAYIKDVGEKIEKKLGFGCGHDVGTDIIDCMERNPFDVHKVVIKDRGRNMEPRIFLIKHTALLQGVKYVLSLTDITEIEKDIEELSKKLHTNPFTGLPNKEALKEVVEELIKSRKEFGTIIFYIKNLDHIIAWHGKEHGVLVEKNTAEDLLHTLTHKEFKKRPFVANFDKNFYIIICDRNDIDKISEFIASIDVSSHLPDHLSSENETIHSTLGTTVFDYYGFVNADDYFAKVKRKYEKIEMG